MDATAEIVIKPSRGRFAIDWRAMFHYRDLLLILVKRDFAAKYRQTILGPAWAIVQPLLNSLVFTVIFAGIGGIPTGKVPHMMFYLSGQLGWTYFAALFALTASVLVTNANLFGKVYFPRLILPLSNGVSGLITFAIQLVTFLVFFAFYKFGPEGHETSVGMTLLLMPVVILQMALLALGTGLIAACMTAKYRDLQQIIPFIVQIWMYVTPVVFPLERVPERWRWVAQINPTSSVVETFRYMFFQDGTFSFMDYGISFAVAVLIFLLGVLMFERVSRTFVDIL